MIRYLYADQLAQYPELARTMFHDRAVQFRDRLNWAVSVDSNGLERDEYDTLNPLYVIWQQANGYHAGSMRILPTVGRTMVNDHFTHLTDGVKIVSPLIWECTRFCISPTTRDSNNVVAGGLMLAGHELGLRFGLAHSVGVFDARMVRIYRAIGWLPEIIGTTGRGRDKICVGLWPFSEETRSQIAQRAGLSPDCGAAWFDAAFPPGPGAIAA